MPLKLECHPASPASPVNEISVDYVLEGSALWLRYHIEGLIAGLDLPGLIENPERTDNLWQQTCCELFLGEPGAERYCEFNFASSGNWAAYQFSGYRSEMGELKLAKSPEVHLDFSETHFAVEVMLKLPDLWINSTLDAGFSMVIADKNGEKSYWALTHPSSRPDFHHRDCFSHKLEAANKS